MEQEVRRRLSRDDGEYVGDYRLSRHMRNFGEYVCCHRISLDEFHTFDADNLLGLSNTIQRADGVLLAICKPPEPPDPNAGTLFEGVNNEQGQQGAA
jgi:hypothetical protein